MKKFTKRHKVQNQYVLSEAPQKDEKAEFQENIEVKVENKEEARLEELEEYKEERKIEMTNEHQKGEQDQRMNYSV